MKNIRNLLAKVKLQTLKSLIEGLNNICKNDFDLFFVHFGVFLLEDYLEIFKMFTFEQLVIDDQINEIKPQIVHIVILFDHWNFFINIIPLFLINSVFLIFQCFGSLFIIIIIIIRLRVGFWFNFLFRVERMRNFFSCILAL